MFLGYVSKLELKFEHLLFLAYYNILIKYDKCMNTFALMNLDLNKTTDFTLN